MHTLRNENIELVKKLYSKLFKIYFEAVNIKFQSYLHTVVMTY